VISNLAIGFPLFLELEAQLRVMVGTRLGLGYRVRVGLGLGLRVGLVVSLLSIADCRYAIRGDRVPVAGTRYTINRITTGAV